MNNLPLNYRVPEGQLSKVLVFVGIYPTKELLDIANVGGYYEGINLPVAIVASVGNFTVYFWDFINEEWVTPSTAEGSFISYAINQLLTEAQKDIARLNTGGLARDKEDTHTGALTQNGSVVINFPNDTHSSTAFQIINTVLDNPGGLFMTQRGSVILRARGDSVTDYYIIRFEGSNALQRVEINNSGIWANQRSAGAFYLLRRDEKTLLNQGNITDAGVIDKLIRDSATPNYRFTAATELHGISEPEIGLVLTLQNDSVDPLLLMHESAVSTIEQDRFNLPNEVDVIIPPKGKVQVIYCTGNRWEIFTKSRQRVDDIDGAFIDVNPAEFSLLDGQLNLKPRSGITADRPPLADVPVGTFYFDTTLGQPIWKKDNTNWVDATGTNS